ncbi:MAG: SDR family NAD(P)-dependent oxidoreductase [Spirochaetales bacterium]|nr:SDR family NAD(P)-dependent oxidoreductase [Spirochaetales bacterium]
MENEKKLVVITGTDSGIGRELAGLFVGKGYTVLACYLDKPAGLKAMDVKLDLRQPDDIVNCSRVVMDYCNTGYSLAFLVLNSAVALGGPIENVPLALYRETFEVNFFGHLDLAKRLIPKLIESKGRIIIHGSAAGTVAAPFLSPYVSTKFALEGFADCLRRELLPFGIRTVLLQTGGVTTPIWERAEKQDISFIDEKYAESMDAFRTKFIRGHKGLSALEAAQQIMRVCEHPNPRPRYRISKSPLRDKLIRVVPDRLLDKIFLKLFSMRYGN